MILIIDGSFFGHRLMHGAGLNFIDNPLEDKQKFLVSATESFLKQIRNVHKNISKVIIAQDYSSWRKQEKIIVPKNFIMESDGYKGNREEKKKAYDEEVFFEVLQEFFDLLESKLDVIVIKRRFAEADDICKILSHEFEQKGIYSLLWTSDGDYLQLLTRYVSLWKLPKEEFYYSNVHYTEADKKNIFSNPTEIEYMKGDFSESNIGTNPIQTLFDKVIKGDKKDNLPPIFAWTRGTTQGKPNDTHFKKLFENKEVNLSNITEEHLYDFDYMRELISELFVISKQVVYEGLDWKKEKNKGFKDILNEALESDDFKKQVDEAMEIYKVNLRLNHLSYKNIPSEIVTDVKQLFYDKNKEQSIALYLNSEEVFNKMGIEKPSNDYFRNFDLGSMQPIVRNEGSLPTQMTTSVEEKEEYKDLMNDIFSNLQ